jgi:hypothetical protein
MLSRHEATGLEGWEGGARGSPESEDLPIAFISFPSRKEET